MTRLQSAFSFDLVLTSRVVDYAWQVGCSERGQLGQLPESRRASQGESPWASSAARRLPAWPCKGRPRHQKWTSYPSFTSAFRKWHCSKVYMLPGTPLHMHIQIRIKQGMRTTDTSACKHPPHCWSEPGTELEEIAQGHFVTHALRGKCPRSGQGRGTTGAAGRAVNLPS